MTYKAIPSDVKQYLQSLRDRDPESYEFLVEKLKEAKSNDDIGLRNRMVSTIQAHEDYQDQSKQNNYAPAAADYQESLKKNASFGGEDIRDIARDFTKGNPEVASFNLKDAFSKEDLSDIRFVVNLLSTSNLSDLIPGMDTKTGRSQQDAMTAGTNILNKKLGLPGKIVYDDKANKFLIEARLNTGKEIKDLRFDLDQTDNFANKMLSKIYAASGEIAQEGPRIAGSLFGLGALLGIAEASGGTAVGAGLAAEKGAEFLGNLASESIARNVYNDAMDGASRDLKTQNLAGEAAITTLGDAPLAAIGGRVATKLGQAAAAPFAAVYGTAKNFLPKLAGASSAAVTAGFDNVESFIGKGLSLGADGLSKLADVAKNVQLPIFKAMFKQSLSPETGVAGSYVALLSNVNKKAFDPVSYKDTTNIQELVGKASANVKGFIGDLKRVVSDPELRNIYQTQARTYLNDIAKEVQSNLQNIVTDKTKFISEGKQNLLNLQNETIGKTKAGLEGKLQSSLDKLSALEKQSVQLEGTNEIAKKELDNLNLELDRIAEEKAGIQSQLNSKVTGTTTASPQEEIGNRLKQEYYGQYQDEASKVRGLYDQAKSIEPTYLDIPQRNEVAQLVDEAYSTFKFNDIAGGPSASKIQTVFEPVMEFTENGPKIKPYISDRDLTDFMTELNQAQNFFSGDTSLSTRQLGKLNDLKIKINQQIIDPLAESSPLIKAQREANLANTVKSARFPEDIQNNLLGSNIKELTGEAANQIANTDTQLVFGNSGVKAAEFLQQLAKDNPTEAKKIFQNLSPELQNDVSLLSKSSLLNNNVDNAGFKDVFGISDFNLPEREAALMGQKTQIKPVDDYISQLEGEIFGTRKEITNLQEQIPSVAKDVTGDFSKALDLTNISDPATLSLKIPEATASLEARGVGPEALNQIPEMVQTNKDLIDYDKILNLLSGIPEQGRTLAPQNIANVTDAGELLTQMAQKSQDKTLIDSATKLDNAAMITAGLSGNSQANKLMFENPDFLSNLSPKEASQAVQSNLSDPTSQMSRASDLARLLTSGALFGTTGQASVANIGGSAAGTAMKLATDGSKNSFFDNLNLGLGRFANIPTSPLINRLPVDNLLMQGPQQLPEDYYSVSRPFKVGTSMNVYQ